MSPLPDTEIVEERREDQRKSDHLVRNWLMSVQAEGESRCAGIATAEEIRAVLDGEDPDRLLRSYLAREPDEMTSGDFGPAGKGH